MKNGRLSFLVLVWCFCFVQVAYAASFANEIKSFDYTSLWWGAVAGFLGGVLRTIFTLSSENTVVYSVLRQAKGDLVASFIAGGMCYAFMIAVSSKYPDLITREIRLVGIVSAGWMGRGFVSAVKTFARNKFASVNRQVRSGSPVSDVVPLMPPLNDRKDGSV